MELLGRVHWRLSRQLAPVCYEENLTEKEVAFLWLVAKKKSCRTTKLAKYMGVPFSTFTGVLDRLETRGLIKRVPNPNSRRSILVCSTPSLHDLLNKMSDKIEKEIRKTLADLPDKDYHQVIDALSLLDQYLDRWEGEKDGF